MSLFVPLVTHSSAQTVAPELPPLLSLLCPLSLPFSIIPSSAFKQPFKNFSAVSLRMKENMKLVCVWLLSQI